MKHTTQPWTAQGRYIMDAHQNVLAVAQLDDGAFPIAEAKANARLISAAPELLDALKWALDQYEELANSGDCGNWDPKTVDFVIAGRAAIAKAEGK